MGLLYSSNTAGAVVGTVVTGFWLIGLWGLNRTYLVAAAVNVCVGVVAVVVARRWDRADDAEDVAGTDAVETVSPAVELDDGRRRVVLITFATSGFVTLALEVIWFRQLILFLESSTYAFTVMLATVLLGIAIGSAAASPCLRRGWVSLRTLAAIEIALGIAALGSFYMLSKAYVVADRASGLLGTGSLTLVIVASALAMLPATLLMGFAFPFGIELWVGADRDRTGERVGTFYAVNVAAGIGGSLVAGFVLIPTIGTRRSLVLLALAIIAMESGSRGGRCHPVEHWRGVPSRWSSRCSSASPSCPIPIARSCSTASLANSWCGWPTTRRRPCRSSRPATTA